MKDNILNNALWFSSERHRRSIELASAFNVEHHILFETSSDISNRLVRYILIYLKTLKIIAKKKPSIIFAQNPSIFLILSLCLHNYIFNFKLIVDRHSNFKFNNNNTIKMRIFHLISRYTLLHSDITIVTNEFLKSYIQTIGGKAFVLPDKLPNLGKVYNKTIDRRTKIVFITSFSNDEPVNEILHSILNLEHKYSFYLTGNYLKYIGNQILKPLTNKKNIHFCGFLPENEYINLLKSADVIVVLTKQEHTLNCGAYEAVALEKPMVLSNTNAIMNYFSKGAIYADPTDSNSITRSIDSAVMDLDRLRFEVNELKVDLKNEWNSIFSILSKQIK